jgi:K+-sensing histidine kinase KdpD
VARSARSIEIDGEGAFWAVAGFAASVLVGVALQPMRESAGLENVVVVYVIVVALTAAVGGRAAGLTSSLSAALAYNWFFTTPYQTLQVDSAEQVATVVLLFLAGLLASLGGRATRRARVEAREEADVLQVLTAVNLAAARTGRKADRVAVEGLRDLLDARAVRVVRQGPEGDPQVTQAGLVDAGLDLDPEHLPHLDEEGRLPSGHRRSVGGTLVLPAEGAVVDLVRRDRCVGALVILPAEDRPILRVTRLAIAAVAHALAMVPDPGGGSSVPPRPPKSA